MAGKATYRAHANIAFLKYWGTRDASLNLPYTHSLSMTLSHAHTTTTVAWQEAPGQRDTIVINGQACTGSARARICAHLDRIRTGSARSLTAHVCSRNSFPTSAGIASSASGFCALTLAAHAALQGTVHERDIPALARLARLASGSACRSFHGGFVEWHAGRDHETSRPIQLHDASHWNLHDLVVVVSEEEKAVSSQNGHRLADSSPLLPTRVDYVNHNLADARQALRSHDLQLLGTIAETDAMLMHAVMLTSRPPLLYLNPASIRLMGMIQAWRRQEALPVYFTVDAGPNLHLLCEAATAAQVQDRLSRLEFVQQVIVNRPGPGPVRMAEHLIQQDFQDLDWTFPSAHREPDA